MLTNTLSFRERMSPSAREELMDYDGIDFESYAAAVRDLASANQLSFGYRPTTGFIQDLAPKAEGRPLKVIDIGSGYGDQLRAIGKTLSKAGIEAELIGVDISPHAAKAMAEVPFDAPGITLRSVTADAFAFIKEAEDAGEQPDILLTTLFMHHLEDDQIVSMLQFLDGSSRLGWFVNDLLRDGLASWGFELMAKALGKHPYVSYDGPVSFARAFRRTDWEKLLGQADVSGAAIKLHHPYRLCAGKVHGD